MEQLSIEGLKIASMRLQLKTADARIEEKPEKEIPNNAFGEIAERINKGEKPLGSEILDAFQKRFPDTKDDDLKQFASVVGIDPTLVKQFLGGKLIQFQGKLQTGAMSDQFKSADGGSYVSYFLLNEEENLKGWGVTKDSIPRHIASFRGMPFVITAKRFFPDSPYGEVTDHPSTDHFGSLGIVLGGIGPMSRAREFNDLMQQAKFQEEFRVGNIEEVFKKSNGDWHALIKIKPQFADMQMPNLVSPALFQLNKDEPANAITTWIGMHLAGLDEQPAYGNKAIYTGSCFGTAGECLTKLSASMRDQPFVPCFKTKLGIMNLRLANIRLDLIMKIGAMISEDHSDIQRQELLCTGPSGQSMSCEEDGVRHEI